MNREACFTFTTPLNVNLVEIKGEEHLFVEGDISTNDIDMVDDIMTKNCQESMQKQILERNMKLDIEHETFKGETHEEKEINKTKIPAGKLIDATVEDLGKERYATRVKGEINRHRTDYKDIKGNLLEKYLDAFSVAFLPIDVTYETREDKKVRLLNDVLLLNVALTGNACNTKAQITEIVTKSMDALEDYKKLKELDPDIEKMLIVKSKESKENPLSYIFHKIMSGKALDKKEVRLLKAALDVADNKGTQAILAKELFDKIVSGIKLSFKDYYIFRELIEINYPEDQESPVTLAGKSHSTSHKGRVLKQLNIENSNKMTEKEDPNKEPGQDPEGEGEGEEEGSEKGEGEGEGEGTESGNAEQKAMLKSVTEEMKALSEKYVVVEKENVELKEAVGEISKNLAKITEALSNPIHKSPGISTTDAAQKAKAGENKTVDPLDLCT